MRCLRCRYDGMEENEDTCPRCNTYQPHLMRDMLPRGSVLENGKYNLNYPLGRGGFGITYHGHHTAFNRSVAIKEFFPHQTVIRDGSDLVVSLNMPEQNDYLKALERFMTAYIVMELIEGKSLRELLDASLDKKLPSAKVQEITEQIVSALSAIHKLDICHLDISPDNIMIDSNGRVVLIDFGAAKQAFKIVHSTLAFKRNYSPIELEMEGAFGPESDLFELSMMIYEMLTGKLPPPSLQRLTSNDVWKPQDVPENWLKLLISGLQLKREDRPKDIKKWWNTFNKGRIILGKSRSKKQIIIGNR
jgi:serine/threonine protein kinase